MSIQYLNNKFKKEKSSFFAKTAKLKENKTDIIDLSLGDPDLITNSEIIQQAAVDAENGYTKYAHPGGDLELRAEIVKYYQKNYNRKINLKEIMVTVGACHGTFLALKAVLNPDEEVIIPTPYFTPYKEQVELAGGKAVFVESDFENKFKLDPKRIEEKINKKTKAIIINSPNNPTGIIQTQEILDKIIKIAEKNDLLILADEVYESFDFENNFYSTINYKDNFERIILLNSFSKTFIMTGWRVGFVIADPDILNVMQNINEGICYSAPTISQRAAVKALKNEKIIKEKIVRKFQQRVKYANQRVKNIKNIELIPAAGAFYLFPRIRNTGLKAEEFALKLLEKKGVLVLPGNDFGDKRGEFIRIACTLELDKLEEAFDRIDQFIKEFSL